MTEKVTKEIAVQEVEKWLDYKRIKQSQRDSQKAQIDVLIEAVMYGDITISDSADTIEQVLAMPVKGLDINTLTYQSRITVMDLHKATDGVKATDFDGRLVAYVSALTGKSPSHLKKMESEDFKIAQAIAVFFM